MPLWVFIAILSYFLTAVNSVVDKYLLKSAVPHPIAYAFFVGLFSIFSLVFTPFGFAWTSWTDFFSAIFVGFVFLGALVAFFSALKIDEASRIVAIVGGFTPIFIAILSSVIFGDYLYGSDVLALALLVAGGVVISARRETRCGLFEFNKFGCIQSTSIAIFAAALFALFFVFAKEVFNHQEFISGFVWTRIGSLLAAVSLLLIPQSRAIIVETLRGAKKSKEKKKGGAIFIINRALAGIAFFILNYAIAIGNPALVNALEGTKFAFVLVLAFILTRLHSRFVSENMNPMAILQKVTAVVFLIAGIAVLSLA